MNTLKTLLLCGAAAGLLSACSATSTHHKANVQQKDKIQSALMRAAEQSGQNTDLIKFERAYKNNPQDANAALDYAQVLRIHHRYDRAAMVLGSFALGEKGTPAVLGEYALVQLALGNYIAAEHYASEAISIDAETTDAKALHALGIAQGVQGRHAEAEGNFRAALQNWSGDPVPVLNNLALNLAQQGRSGEALSFIQQASTLAPQRTDIQNNQRIILALTDGRLSKAPKPHDKPIYR